MTTITPDQGNNGTEDGGDGDNDENDESNNSNTGLLAGAIVGGVVGVAGLVLLIAWVISRKRRRNLESGMDTVQHRPFDYGRGESVGGFVGGVPPGSIGGGTKSVGTGVNTNSNGYSGYGDNVREWNRGADATNSAFNIHTGYASSAASTHTRATNASLLPNELRQRSPTIQGLDRTSQNLWTTASPPSSGTGAPMVAPAGVNITSPVARSSPPAIRMVSSFCYNYRSNPRVLMNYPRSHQLSPHHLARSLLPLPAFHIYPAHRATPSLRHRRYLKTMIRRRILTLMEHLHNLKNLEGYTHMQPIEYRLINLHPFQFHCRRFVNSFFPLHLDWTFFLFHSPSQIETLVFSYIHAQTCISCCWHILFLYFFNQVVKVIAGSLSTPSKYSYSSSQLDRLTFL